MKSRSGWCFPDLDEHMYQAMSEKGYQAAHLEAALQFVTDRRVALDCGAHVGQFSIPLSRVFDRVIAVEPAKDSATCLMANLVKFGCGNVEMKNVAVGSAVGTCHLALDEKEEARGNTGGRYVVAGGVIPIERIDDWNMPVLDFLKADCEGSEPLILLGAVKTLKRCQPVVLFEEKGFARRYGQRPNASAAILTKIGYSLMQTVGHDHIWAVRH